MNKKKNKHPEILAQGWIPVPVHQDCFVKENLGRAWHPIWAIEYPSCVEIRKLAELFCKPTNIHMPFKPHFWSLLSNPPQRSASFLAPKNHNINVGTIETTPKNTTIGYLLRPVRVIMELFTSLGIHEPSLRLCLLTGGVRMLSHSPSPQTFKLVRSQSAVTITIQTSSGRASINHTVQKILRAFTRQFV